MGINDRIKCGIVHVLPSSSSDPLMINHKRGCGKLCQTFKMWIPHCVYQSWSTLDDLIGSSVYHIARPVSRSYSTTMPQTSHDHARSNVREDSVTLWKEAFDLPLGMSRGT